MGGQLGLSLCWLCPLELGFGKLPVAVASAALAAATLTVAAATLAKPAAAEPSVAALALALAPAAVLQVRFPQSESE